MTVDQHQRFRWVADYALEFLRRAPNANSELGTTVSLLPWQRAELQVQRELRIRARRRFPDPERWLWTDRSLSQASDWASAQFKASLFPDEAEHVVDACCGAGVDTVALAGRFSTLGLDRDAALMQLTAANVKAHDSSATLRIEEFDERKVQDTTHLHIDPDRRSMALRSQGDFRGTRTTHADEFEPSIDSVLRAATRARGAMLKLAPSTEFTEHQMECVQSQAIRGWLGNRGECRQQLALFGAVAEFARSRLGLAPHQRWATLTVPPQACPSAVQPQPAPSNPQPCGLTQAVFAGQPEPTEQLQEHVGPYVYDLHSTLFAAELYGAWANQSGLSAITSPLGYYTSEQQLTSPWAQTFEVLEVVAWDDRKLRKVLRQLDAGHVEVKTRLHKLDANWAQRRYSSGQGTAKITLLVTRFDKSLKAIVARRLTDSD